MPRPYLRRDLLALFLTTTLRGETIQLKGQPEYARLYRFRRQRPRSKILVRLFRSGGVCLHTSLQVVLPAKLVSSELMILFRKASGTPQLSDTMLEQIIAGATCIDV